MLHALMLCSPHIAADAFGSVLWSVHVAADALGTVSIRRGKCMVTMCCAVTDQHGWAMRLEGIMCLVMCIQQLPLTRLRQQKTTGASLSRLALSKDLCVLTYLTVASASAELVMSLTEPVLMFDVAGSCSIAGLLHGQTILVVYKASDGCCRCLRSG